MQRLHYTGDSVLVSDELCDALLDYAVALAGSQASDALKVGVVDETGNEVIATLLLGPASQLYATPAEGVAEVEVDTVLVEDIRQRTRLLQPSFVSAQPADSPGTTPDLDME